MTPLEWLQLLFGDAENGWVTISLKADAAARCTPDDPFETRWHHVSDLGAAAKDAATLDRNVYFGLGLRRSKLPGSQRGCIKDVIALPGLWVEIDCAGGSHDGSAKRYFPSKDAARAFLESELPHRPSALIDSGGGLHAYWLFSELWTLDADDLDHAQALERGWQAYIRSRTTYDIDSTHDLARVLRVPGTRNLKDGAARDVLLIYDDGPRYDPSSFDDWAELVAGPHQVPLPQGLTHNPTAEPPGIKLMALFEADKRFRDTWERKRPDFRDQSPSSYCLSLATTAAQAGWSDQEIQDLLIAWRRQQHADPKRPGWYALTVAKARTTPTNTQQTAAEDAAERLESTDEPDEKLAALSLMLGIRIRRVVRWHRVDRGGVITEPSFTIETDRGKVVIPNAADIISRTRFTSIVAGTLKHLVEVPPKMWSTAAKALLSVTVDEDASEEESPYAAIRDRVAEYAARLGKTDDPLAAHDSKQLYEADGQLWIPYSRFADWLRITKGERVGARNLPQLLRLAGLRRVCVNNLKRSGGRTTQLVFWEVPRA